MPTNRQRIEDLLAKYEPEIQAAFLAAVEDLKNHAEIGKIAQMLEAGNVEGALAALHIDAAAYRGIEASIAAAFDAGGVSAVSTLPSLADSAGNKLVLRFDVRNPRAENWLKQHSSNLITRIVNDQAEAVRDTLRTGMVDGRNPRNVALDIVGRINQKTKRREGGIVGLTEPQAKSVSRARQELLSGDEKQLKNYLTRELRDKRFDPHVNRAIKEVERQIAETKQALKKANASPDQVDAAIRRLRGKLAKENLVPPNTTSRMVGRYADSKLRLRGEMIARTEALASLNKSQDEAFRQAVDSGAIRKQDVRRTWVSSFDRRVRDTHRSMNGQTVSIDEPFVSPSGAQLQYPGDPSAPAEEIINCFHPETKILLTGIKGTISRHYRGVLVEISIGSKVNLSVTPNHLILTDRGWVAASKVVEGDNVIQCRVTNIWGGTRKPNVDNIEARADDIYRSVKMKWGMHRAARGVVDLHGEIPSEDVYVVSIEGGLRGAFNARCLKRLDNILFSKSRIKEGSLLYGSLLTPRGRSLAKAADSVVGFCDSTFSFFRGCFFRAPPVALRYIRAIYPQVIEAHIYRAATDFKFSGNSQNRIPIIVKVSNRIKMLLPSLFGSCFGVDSFKRIRCFWCDWLYPHVAHTAQCHVWGYAQFLRDNACGKVFHSHVCNGRVKLNPVVAKSLCRPFSTGSFLSRFGYDFVRKAVACLEFFGTFFDRIPADIMSNDKVGYTFTSVQVEKASMRHYDGPVYNFETKSGLIVSDNIVTHNCRCVVSTRVDFLSNVE